MRKIGTVLVAAATLVACSLGGWAIAEGSIESDQHKFVQAPPGFVDACRRYGWLCSNPPVRNREQKRSLDPEITLEVARDVNRRVNQSVREVTDQKIYGVADYWSLPKNGRGDCEDFVLMKYKTLLDSGIDQKYLSIAVVLTRKGENHAVLLLHHSSGDFVLDSLSSGIKIWNESPYRFLAAQSHVDKSKWVLVTKSRKDHFALARR